MAQAREKGGRVVFIGNIPYGVSEEQICDIFARIGSVLSFRLVYDKETGKPKGFGFLEYPDVDQAAAAVRNLNGFEIMGRQLKVDYSNDNSGGGGGTQGNRGGQGETNRAPPPAHFDMNVTHQPQVVNGAAELPPLPQGIEVPPGLTAPDAISKTLQQIPAPQLLDILSQMKSLVASEPGKATAILQQAPQLSYAIFQALLLLGLVDTNVLGSLIQGTQQQPTQPPQTQQQPPMQAYQQQPPPQMQQHQQPPPTTYAQQPPYAAYQQQPGYAPTPPAQQHPAYHPPPPQQPPQQTYQQPPYQPAPAPPQQQQDPSQQALIQQVLAMTREQIFALDEQPRNQILQLRAQLGAPVS